MATRQALDVFPVEVWTPILKNLCKAVPAPLSHPDRKAMSNSALASAARTCKLFHEICTPLLYRVIVTDDLPVVFAQIYTPSFHKSIAFIEEIYVEYAEEMSDLTYPLIFLGAKRKWGHLSVRPLPEANVMAWCAIEVERLTQMCVRLVKGNPRILLPRPHSIAISSIYGQSDNLWQRYHEWQSEKGGILLDAAKVNWDRFIAASDVKHVCVRDTFGPLSQTPLCAELKRPNENRPSMTLHFSEKVDEMSIRPGMPIRWISDIPMDRPWHQTYYDLVKGFIRIAMRRNRTEELIEDPYYLCRLDVYFSTNVLGPPPSGDLARHLTDLAEEAGISLNEGAVISTEKQRAIAGEIGSYLEEWVIDDGCDDFADEINWHASADAPICQACGSGAPG